jgi:hypothetical protein
VSGFHEEVVPLRGDGFPLTEQDIDRAETVVVAAHSHRKGTG